MDALINFEHNGRLFECDPDEFNITIKSVLTDILVHQFIPIIDRNCQYRQLKCISCWQIVNDNSLFLICDQCCKACIGENKLIAIMSYDVFICYKTHHNYWREIGTQSLNKNIKSFYKSDYYNDKSSWLKYFVNSSHKLINRFYHSVPILFLLALRDPKSDCSVLNRDIVFFTFKFIY